MSVVPIFNPIDRSGLDKTLSINAFCQEINSQPVPWMPIRWTDTKKCGSWIWAYSGVYNYTNDKASFRKNGCDPIQYVK